MFQTLRDLPFFDALAPLLAVGLVWGVIHTAYIGPEIVAPRLAGKTYVPLCQARVAQFRDIFEAEITAEETRRAALQAEADRRWMETNVARDEAYQQALREAERLAAQAAEQARKAVSMQDQIGIAIVGETVGQLFGEEAGEQAGQVVGLLQGLSRLTQLPSLPERPAIPDVPLPQFEMREVLRFEELPRFPVDGDYCGCVIAEAFANPIDTGLFSASFRLWKPEGVRRLDQFRSNLLASAQCGFDPR